MYILKIRGVKNGTKKDKLVSLRKGKGLSQLELAEILNVSRQSISRWEVGTSVPTMEKLIALSKLYDIPLDELIHQKEGQENTVQVLEQNEKEEKEGEKQQEIYKEYHHIRKSIDRISIGVLLILVVLVSCIVIYCIVIYCMTNREFSAIPIEKLDRYVIEPEDIELGETEAITDDRP